MMARTAKQLEVELQLALTNYSRCLVVTDDEIDEETLETISAKLKQAGSKMIIEKSRIIRHVIAKIDAKMHRPTQVYADNSFAVLSK